MKTDAHGHILAILALCFSQAVGVATNTHIFPFIASLMLAKGVEEHQVSTYAGLAESAISFAFLLCMRLHVWAVGCMPHRRLQIASLLACGTISALLGFAPNAWLILVLRSLTGVVAVGSVLNVVVLGDLIDEDTRDRAFSWFTAGSYFGFMSGAAISGYLAEPYHRVPILGDLELFAQNPYILPGCILLVCSVISSLAVYLFVPETSPKYRSDRSEDP